MTSPSHEACPGCGATRDVVRLDGHRWLTHSGRPVVACLTAPAGSLPCPEACSCIPECFSMAEHEDAQLSADRVRHQGG